MAKVMPELPSHKVHWDSVTPPAARERTLGRAPDWIWIAEDFRDAYEVGTRHIHQEFNRCDSSFNQVLPIAYHTIMCLK